MGYEPEPKMIEILFVYMIPVTLLSVAIMLVCYAFMGAQ
jgi:hypothetical protein